LAHFFKVAGGPSMGPRSDNRGYASRLELLIALRVSSFLARGLLSGTSTSLC
jgi:hypothetical protein